MKVGQMRSVLKIAEEQYRGDGKIDVAEALSAVAANLLVGAQKETVTAFVKRVEKARKPTAPNPSQRQRKR